MQKYELIKKLEESQKLINQLLIKIRSDVELKDFSVQVSIGDLKKYFDDLYIQYKESCIFIAITDGAVNQSYINVTPLISKRLAKIGDIVTIICSREIQDRLHLEKDRFVTSITSGSYLKNRSFAKKLYETYEVSDLSAILVFVPKSEKTFEIDIIDDAELEELKSCDNYSNIESRVNDIYY